MRVETSLRCKNEENVALAQWQRAMAAGRAGTHARLPKIQSGRDDATRAAVRTPHSPLSPKGSGQMRFYRVTGPQGRKPNTPERQIWERAE